MKVISSKTKRSGFLWLNKTRRLEHRVETPSGIVKVLEKQPSPNHRVFEVVAESPDVLEEDILNVMKHTKTLFPLETT